ncbi:methyltransferase domain-containing protein [Silvanigrella paludirubra]|uniref:Methyltransferase domain-containing protein n=1 Tax=Silvanigrella paludirubra TaxID=2499159 RepID=A0A6N6VUL9_9BACT|nr:class I SAM-dependent methyltransferase [Silvanigrella paludirubra]KAB8039449.1 methyltransferase domain-containing protein [Silvanigrella paludirubra]
MKCKICFENASFFTTENIMPQKFKAHYYLCHNCEYLFIDKPNWLEISYSEAITDSDIGLVNRNARLSVITYAIIRLFFKQEKQFLDYAGGYGLFVRKMRNLGLNFFWQDKYAKNLFAKTFSAEENNIKNYGLITAFEVMEHLEDPIKELEKLFNLSNNILISTELLPEHKPKPNEWHYFALEHGQHIGFFSRKTMEFIAHKYGFNYYTNESDIHLFTKKKISKILFKLVMRFKFSLLYRYVFKLKSLQEADQAKMIKYQKAS